MSEEINPFALSGYRGPAYFCDREVEVRQITGLMQNGAAIALFASRRMGKTALIHHVFYPFSNSKKLACIYLDILATTSLSDFTNYLATAVYNRFPPGKPLGKRIMELLQLFRPVISIDALSGKASLNLSLENQAQKVESIQKILSFLDGQGLRVVIAIDEFQQVLTYPEKNTEALLRTQIQTMKNTSFIFCGSNQSMMREIFSSAGRPFYASCTSMSLGRIGEEKYRAFIKKKFGESGRKIGDECIDFICSWTCLHTFYTQYLCFVLFAMKRKNNTTEEAHEAAMEILKMNEGTYFQYRNLLTAAQWHLLRAIASEEKVFRPQSAGFISKYSLGTPSLVSRGLEALMKKELVLYHADAGEPFYEVYDKFLMRWIQQQYGRPLLET